MKYHHGVLVLGLIILLVYTVSASFTTNTSYGSIQQAVQFIDTSTGETSRNWTYTNLTPGNNTPIEFGNNAHNPVQTFGAGNWTITLNATTSTGYNITTKTIKIFDVMDGRLILPANSVYNYNISQLPTIPQGAVWASTFGTLRLGEYYVNYVDSTVPTVAIDFSHPASSDLGTIYPVHNATQATGGSDRESVVYVTDTNQFYEIYQFVKNNATSYSANLGIHVNGSSNALRGNYTDFFTPTTLASGEYIFPTLVRYDEVMNGSINHAMGCAIPASNYSHVWVARNNGQANTNNTFPPLGARIRLNASFSVASFNPKTQVVLNALKNYGCIITDHTGSYHWSIRVAKDPRWNTAWGGDLALYDPDIPTSSLEFVDYSMLMSDPNSGEVATNITPRASFTTDKTTVRVPGRVVFTDTSTFAPATFNWYFNDGSANTTTESPTHQYTRRGTFAACLEASNVLGMNTSCTNIKAIGYASPQSFVNGDIVADTELQAYLIIGVFALFLAALGYRRWKK